jgi:hypothetical protein
VITLYTWATPNGRKTSVMLEECELPYSVAPSMRDLPMAGVLLCETCTAGIEAALAKKAQRGVLRSGCRICQQAV